MMIKEYDEGRHIDAPKGGQALTCEEFQAQMPEFMGGAIHEHEHLKSCDRCSALIEELEQIADAAKRLLPAYEPPDSLWTKISRSIHQAPDDGENPGVLKMVAIGSA